MGEPDDAVGLFNEILGAQLKSDATPGSKAAFTEARGLAQEALGDAQWARGDPATAYKTYLNTIEQPAAHPDGLAPSSGSVWASCSRGLRANALRYADHVGERHCPGPEGASAT